MTNGGTLPSRADTLALMHEFTASESLRKHMLAVEGAMRAYAQKFGEDEERWGTTGLIHDFDYERFPNNSHSPTEEHPSEGVRLLRSKGYPEDILEAMIGKFHREEKEESFVMEKLGEGRWRVSGTMRLDDFRREYPDLGTNNRCRDIPVNEFCLLHFTRLDHELVCAVAIDHGSTRTVEIRRLIQQLAVTELARSISHGDRPARHAGALGP